MVLGLVFGIFFGLHTHLVVSSLDDDLPLGFCGFHCCLVDLSERLDAFRCEVGYGL